MIPKHTPVWLPFAGGQAGGEIPYKFCYEERLDYKSHSNHPVQYIYLMLFSWQTFNVEHDIVTTTLAR